MQNVNNSSVPGEASVGFSTSPVYSAPAYSGVTVNADTTTLISALNASLPALETQQAVYFTGSTISNLSNNTLYWIGAVTPTIGGNVTIGIFSAYGGTPISTLGLTGTATLSTYNLTLGTRGPMTKNYMVESSVISPQTGNQAHWLVDSNGLVWSDVVVTGTTSSWTYVGNLSTGGAYGNGLVYYRTVNSIYPQTMDGWLFVFRNSAIDYLKIESGGASGSTAIVSTALSWVYGWQPSTEKTAQSNYLNNPQSSTVSHETIVTPDGRVCYCDGYLIGTFYQNPPIGGVWTTFSPIDNTTYTFSTYPILPVNDVAQCMSYLGSYLYIGGQKNVIYPWDLTDTQYSNPLILLAENNITSLITVNTNLFIFCGNRGRIYLSNGSQAQLYKKVPDFLSGTVQPTFTWGGTAFNMNKLYFGFYARANGVTNAQLTAYNGIWSIDLDTESLICSNSLSTSSIATVLFPINIDVETLNGYGLYIAWATTPAGTVSGIDVTSSTPYTAGQSYIISDMIPVGTVLKKNTPLQIEFKLSSPLLTSETVELKTAQSLAALTNDTLFTTLGVVTGDGTLISANLPLNDQLFQWLLVKVILTGNASSPSYNRLTQIRIVQGSSTALTYGATATNPAFS
jgi:hypothetical protein